MDSLRSLGLIGAAALAFACSSASVRQVPISKASDENAHGLSVYAPFASIFLYESGLVTFEGTLLPTPADMPPTCVTATLAFDRWGHRQATSGYPWPKEDKIVIFDGEHVITYVPARRSAEVTPWQAVAVFTPQERRTLREAFPATRESDRTIKTVAGVRCKVTSTMTKLPTNDMTTHSECVGRGIPLEITDSVWGPNVHESWLHLVAIKIDLDAKVPESYFRIPDDVAIIDRRDTVDQGPESTQVNHLRPATRTGRGNYDSIRD